MKKRKVCALVVSCAMLVSLLPTTIFAEEDGEEENAAVEITEAEPEEEESGSADLVIGGGGTVSLVPDDEKKTDSAEQDAQEEPEEEPEEDDEDVVYQAESGSVRVEVTAPAGALPEDAKLSVERYAKDSANYRDAAEAIDLDEGSDMAALDISFLVDGKEVEPSEPVKVSIDVSDILPEDADASTLEVQHLVETPNNTIKPVVVANESSATEGTINEKKATAEFEVESFSAFTVTWTLSGGPAAGTTYSLSVTAYLDGVELNDITGLTFDSENDELDFETLLSDVGYGTGDYTFSYAIVTVGNQTYGSQENPVVAIEIDQGTGGPTSTTNFLLVYADGTTGTVATSSTVSVSAYYLTPDFSVSIEAVDEDETTEAWALQAVLSHAGSYESISYEWTVTDGDGSTSQYAKVTNTDNTGRAYIAWEDGTPDNTEVTVSVTVTLTLADGETKTATADYVLEYGDETVDLIMTYGPDKTALPAGVTVTLTSESGEHVYSGTTDSDGWVHDLEIEPGIYTVTATYTDSEGNTYQCSETVAMHDAGNYYINLNYYNEEILTSVPERSNWEHIDIKLSVGTTSNSDSGSVSVNITGAQIIGSDGTVKYTATEDTIEGNDNEFQLSFYEGDGSTGTADHSVSFDTGDTITITYVLTINGVEQSPSTITITADTKYDEGTTYPVTGQRAYKLYNYLYGTSYSSDAQLIADGVGDIDISGMSMMLVAAILCDSSEVTGAGQVQAVDGQSANQWGMDFALSIEALNELAASWAFNIEKTYENASMTAGDFVFYLYNATVSGNTWSLGDLQSTLTNQTAGMDWDGNSHDTMELFSIAYSDEAIQNGETYYYILYEQPDTVTSGSGATITFDGTIFGVMVQLGTDADGEATVTATYYRMEQNGDTYTIAETYTTGSNVDGKITFDSDDYATFEFTNNYQNYTEISGEKTWVDNDNAYNTRPESITINLLVNGQPALDDNGDPITATVTAADNWSWSFTDLPMYDGVTELTYSYSIAEESVPGYTTTYDDDGNPVNTLTGETEISVEKEWVDNDDANKNRPESITVTITGSDGDEYTNEYTITLSNDNNWSYTLSNLPLYTDQGVEITYEVTEEDITGYDGDVADNGDGTYTITNTLETTDITAIKVWNDDDNRDGVEPTSVQVQLKADEENVGNAVTLDDGDSWTYTWTDLPVYVNGQEVTYTIEEVEVPDGYTMTPYEVDSDGNVTFVVVNTHEDALTQITVNKEWQDADNENGTRPDDVTVQLMANGAASGEAVTLDESNSWGYTWENLYSYEDGELIEYTVEETAVDGYTTEIGELTPVYDNDNNLTGYTITVTNTRTGETGSSVEKEWVDNDNADNTRTGSITVTITGSDESTYTLTLSDANEWSDTLSELPLYDSEGEEITYTVTEEEIENYDGDVVDNGDGSYTITNTLTGETEISVEKEWVDNDNAYETRPDNITVTITGSDGNTYTLTLSDDNGWSDTLSELPKYDSTGTEITYTVTEEEIENYDGDVVDNGDGTYTITNTLTGETEISVEKKWVGDEAETSNRPESITVTITGSDESTYTLTLSGENNWSDTLSKLPLYDSTGTEITYEVTEEDVTGYDGDVADNRNGTYTITNTLQTTQVSVIKVWNDDEDRDGTRTDSVQVQLKAGEDNVGEAVKLNDADDWTYTWTELPVYVDGKEVTYTVEEVEIPDEYTASYSSETDDDGNLAFTMVNTHEDAKTQITVKKEWQDADNENGIRPDDVTVQLMANGVASGDAVTLNEGNDWSYTWKDLYSFEDGELIEYTVEEIEVEGYTTDIGELTPVYDDNNLTGYTITVTNTRTGVTGITVNKTWADDSEDMYGTRPESVTVIVTGSDGSEYELTLTADNDWAVTKDDLPLYDSEGTEITYKVTEETVNGYTGEVVDNKDGTYTITNTLQTTELSGSKKWAYDKESDRPNSITIFLCADGEYALDADGNQITTTAKGDDWSWSFTDLPKYNSDGEEIVYTVLEGEVSGYIPTYDTDADGNVTITNALPEVHKGVSDPSYGESTDDDQHEDEADNNDTLEYKMEADHIGGAHDLVLHDYLSDQLDISTLEIQSVTLYPSEGADGTVLEEGKDYTVSTGECSADCGLEGCSFEIHVFDEDVEDLSADAYVIVIFDIDLNEDAEDFSDNYVDEIDNDVGLSFTVFNIATYAEPDETETFSYGFKLYKYDVDNNNEPLAGVGFVLSRDGNNGTQYATFTVTENTYLFKGWVDSEDEATTIYSGSDGTAVIEGLHDGTFNIIETEPLEGYQQIVGNMTVTITVDDDLSAPSISATGAEADGSDVKIGNTAGENMITIAGSKTWDDGDDADGVRPDSITIHLLADGSAALDADGNEITATVTADDGWGWSFPDLPKYNSDGSEISYTITEDAIDGYTSSVNGYDVTNTHEYETRDIAGAKTWDDDNDKASARPASITVHLYQDGELYDSKTVTEADGWAWSWTDLPKNKNGEAIAYTIKEEAEKYYVPSYETGNFNITNTFVGEEGAEHPTSGPDQGGDQPKTGDMSNLGTWLALLIAAIACALVGFRMRRRPQK